jgi:hypothetical protein
MSFGVDDRVAVSYRLAKGERSREGLISKDRRIERRYLITVTNHHQRPISVTLVDQLPVPRDERIEVELLDDATPPSATDFEDRSGVLAWVRDYAPGESRTLRFGYAVSYPEPAFRLRRELPRGGEGPWILTQNPWLDWPGAPCRRPSSIAADVARPIVAPIRASSPASRISRAWPVASGSAPRWHG